MCVDYRPIKIIVHVVKVPIVPVILPYSMCIFSSRIDIDFSDLDLSRVAGRSEIMYQTTYMYTRPFPNFRLSHRNHPNNRLPLHDPLVHRPRHHGCLHPGFSTVTSRA